MVARIPAPSRQGGFHLTARALAVFSAAPRLTGEDSPAEPHRASPTRMIPLPRKQVPELWPNRAPPWSAPYPTPPSFTDTAYI